MAASTADPIDVFVGQRLRAIRLARNKTQAALGRALGTSFQQVQKYELGANRVSASTLVRAADFLGVPVADLFPSSESSVATELRAAQFAATVTGRDIIEAWPRVPPAVRAEIGLMVNSAARSRRRPWRSR